MDRKSSSFSMSAGDCKAFWGQEVSRSPAFAQASQVPPVRTDVTRSQVRVMVTTWSVGNSPNRQQIWPLCR